MKRVLRTSTILLIAGLIGCASGPKGTSGNSGPAPLIDRALFFGDPVIAGGELSPDGQFMAFIKPYNGVRNIWVKRLDESFDQARPITADKRPVPVFFWSRDGRYVLYAQDKDGNENFHIYAVDPAGQPDASTGVPAGRDLTGIDGVRAVLYGLPRNAPNTVLVGLNDRDQSYHDVYRVNIATGERELIAKNDKNLAGYVFDPQGNARLAIRPIQGGGSELLRIDGDNLVSIYRTTYEEQVYPLSFHPDGKRVYVETNKGSDVDLSRLMLMDLATGQTELVESDPEAQVDFGRAIFDDETDELLATMYVGDRVRIYPKTDQTRRDLEVLRAKFPNEELGIRSSTKDLKLWLVSVSSDVDPGSVYLYKRDTGEITLMYRSRPDLPSEHLAPMQPVRYQARDGLEIPAYLTTPKGVEAKNLPTIMFVHGGPWARDNWGYDPYAQFLANRGYAVLQPNFRSSSGFGKKFLNAGNRTWGTGAMQHDITDGVQWLVDQGIADASKICIFGGSYGGYATLAGVTFTPDLYACGVPYVAPSNLITLIDSFPAYWRPFLESSWYKRVGDPAVAADRKDMEARSPLNFVDRIKVPLLVVHGANDPRVKQAESDQIIVALRENGHAAEYIVAPDEGHGFRSPDNNKALAVAIERFLAKHLGGRVQQEVPAEVAKRLTEITVDINTVKQPSATETQLAEQATTAPLPDTNGDAIKPASSAYKVNVQAGGQNIEMVMNRTIDAVNEGGKAAWRIVDVVDTPRGQSIDTVFVDKATLLPLKRTVSGMMEGEFTHTDTEVKGKMKLMGQKADVAISLTAPVFADGPGLVIAIAGLPLASGYQTALRKVDVITQKPEAYKLKVTGEASVKVAAGSFDTLVIEVKPLGSATDSAKVWVTKQAPHYVVKGEYKLPAYMGGASLTIELTKK